MHSSVGKESTCNAEDPGSIPGLGGSPGEGIGYLLQYSWASLVAQLVKNLPAMHVDLSLIPGLGRSPGEGKGYPLWYSGPENPMDCGMGWQRVGHDGMTVTMLPVRPVDTLLTLASRLKSPGEHLKLAVWGLP